MRLQGLPDWAARSYECFERKLAKPEVSWNFDKNFPYYDEKFGGQLESYMGLDETIADQAREQPNLVVLQHKEGTLVTASGDSKEGYYVEAEDAKVTVARFSPEAMDHVEIDKEGGCEWVHVDRQNTKRSYILLFQVDPSQLEVEALTSNPKGGGVAEGPGAVVVGGSSVRKRGS